MKIYEIINTIKTYTARVKLKNCSWVKTSVEAENSSQAMQLLKYLYLSVSLVTEFTEQEDKLDEAAATKTPSATSSQSIS
jgi:hypothetical protein